MKRSFIREILEHTSSDTISFAGGLPDKELFPLCDIQQAAMLALSSPKSLQYSTSTGYEPLKEQIAQMYCDAGFETCSDEIMITSGSQQGLDIICRYHSRETIAIEKPSYLGAMNLFILNNMTIQDMDFIDKSKLAYLIPDFQNPTGKTYSTAKRKEIADMCKKHSTILIEDAPYTQLYFDAPSPSIASLIPHQSYHLGSFSKTLAPAFRIGWIRASSDMIAPLVAYKEAMDLHTSSISQRIVSQYLQDTKAYKAHLSKLRTNYKQKMHYFTKLIDKYLPEFEYERPDGGMFVYGKLAEVDTMKLVRVCMKHGVVFVPGGEFGGGSDEIRFNYTHSSYEDMELGMSRLADTLKKYKIAQK